MFSPLGNVPWFFFWPHGGNDSVPESRSGWMKSDTVYVQLFVAINLHENRIQKGYETRYPSIFHIYIFPHMFPFSKHETWIFHVFLSMFSSQTQKSLHLALATSRALRGSYCWMRLASGGCFQKWISYRMPPVDRVQLPQTSGWILYILWFMECLW